MRGRGRWASLNRPGSHDPGAGTIIINRYCGLHLCANCAGAWQQVKPLRVLPEVRFLLLAKAGQCTEKSCSEQANSLRTGRICNYGDSFARRKFSWVTSETSGGFLRFLFHFEQISHGVSPVPTSTVKRIANRRGDRIRDFGVTIAVTKAVVCS